MIFILVFVVSLIAAYLLICAAKPLALIAYPGEHRQHNQATPLVGGIAIFIGLLIGIISVADDAINLLPSLVILCLVGAIDDRFKLPSWSRFIVQALAVLLMIELTGVQLTNLGSLIADHDILLNNWSMPLTVFATIGVINAVNMSDGMDGLVGSLLILILLALALSSNNSHTLIIVSIASIAGFLVWNLRLFRARARIFMGDAGSTMLGLLMAYLLIKLTQQPYQAMPPVTALWFLALPLCDTVAVLLLRPLKGRSPFTADRIHYHHLLKAGGLSVNQTLLCILLIQGAFIAAGFAMQTTNIADNVQFFAFLVCFAIYFLMLAFVTRNSGAKKLDAN